MLLGLMGQLVGCKRSVETVESPLEEVILETGDGFFLTGNFYVPENILPRPGLILLHMYNSDKAAWERFARRAQQEGYLCIAYDMRGHGGSRNENWNPKSSRDPWRDEDVRSALDDIRYAKGELVERGADPNNLFIVGASIGANMGLTFAKNDPDIQGVVMISPGLKYKNLSIEKTITEIVYCPILIMASEGDSYAASSSSALKEKALGYSELRTYKGSAHGTDLLDTNDSAILQILQWLEPIIAE